MFHAFLRKAAVLCFTVLLFSKAHAQYNSIDWSAYLTDKNLALKDSELVEHLLITHESGQDYVYLCGQTFSTTPANKICEDSLGNGDCFLAKYNSKGKLKWIRYFGGAGNRDDTTISERYDWAYCLASDVAPSGNVRIYVGGTSLKNTAAVDCGNVFCNDEVYQPQLNDSWEGFISKFDGDGNLLRFTYLGGGDSAQTDTDEVLGLAVYNHSIYAVGYTESDQQTLIQPAKLHTCFDTTYNGAGDGFLAVMDTCLSSLEFFTYFSSSDTLNDSASTPDGQDRIHDVIVSTNGSIYLTGST